MAGIIQKKNPCHDYSICYDICAATWPQLTLNHLRCVQTSLSMARIGLFTKRHSTSRLLSMGRREKSQGRDGKPVNLVSWLLILQEVHADECMQKSVKCGLVSSGTQAWHTGGAPVFQTGKVGSIPSACFVSRITFLRGWVMRLGRLEIKASRWPWQGYGWFSTKNNPKAYLNPSGARFGGGWRWCLGVRIGGDTVMMELLFGMLRFAWLPKKVNYQNQLSKKFNDDAKEFCVRRSR